MSETITEDILIDLLKKKKFYSNKEILVERKNTKDNRIKKILEFASKSGEGAGYPDFIITFKKYPDFLILIEAKSDIKKHESVNKDKFKDYAVDGALLYSSYASRQMDVLSIAVSGQKKNMLRISHFLQVQGNDVVDLEINKILNPDEYYNKYIFSEKKEKNEFNKLLSYTKKLNNLFHKNKIQTHQRALVFSGILIALKNNAFNKSFTKHERVKDLIRALISAINTEIEKIEIEDSKKSIIKNQFSFIRTQKSLSKNNNFLLDVIIGINDEINNFTKNYEFYDLIGEFYIEFLRYANSDKGLGIVLTPKHIAELFVDLIGITKDSKIYDNCCGTGTFLVAAMKRMLSSNLSSRQIKRIKENNIIGTEYQDDKFSLCITNMILNNDGKTKIFNDSCFENIEEIKKLNPNAGILNPPYGAEEEEESNELEFILNNLETIEKEGRIIAVIPVSSLNNNQSKEYALKKLLLENHTIEAVFSLPEDLFHNSKVTVPTCAVIIKAKVPNKNNKTYLGYWRGDDFFKTKDLGRIESDKWPLIRKKWIMDFKDKKTSGCIVNNHNVDFLSQNNTSILKKLSAEDEWCIENYLELDYNFLDYRHFKHYLKSYVKDYFGENFNYFMNILVENKKDTLLNEILNFKPDQDKKIETTKLVDIFETYNGLASNKVLRHEEKENDNFIPYMRPSHSQSSSVDAYVNKNEIDEKYVFNKNSIYVSTDGQGSHSYAYVSLSEFIPNSNVTVLKPRKKMSLIEKIFYGYCISINRFKFSYGRKPKGKRLEDIMLPINTSCLKGIDFKNIFT